LRARENVALTQHAARRRKNMATFSPYVGVGTRTGSKQSIWANIVFFVHVGSGSFTAFSDYALSFAGEIKTAVFNGDLNLSCSITEQNPNSLNGPCEIIINGITATSASYSVTGGQLIVAADFPGGIKQKINIQQGGNGGRETHLDLSGDKHEYKVHLTPSS
jgi:hypothetical protein